MVLGNQNESNDDGADDDRNRSLPGRNGGIDRRGFLKAAGAAATVPLLANQARAAPASRHLEVVSTGSETISYQFSATGEIAPATDSALEGAEEIAQNDDGTWTATGNVVGHGRDAFTFQGDLVEFTPAEGAFEVYLDGFAVAPAAIAGEESQPSVPQPTDVLGGGESYPNTVPESEADVVVASHEELVDALGSASSGDVVYVAGDATIDVGDAEMTIPSGITLASDRGIDGAAGGQIRTDTFDTWPGMFTVESDVRVTGVRISGPMESYEEYHKPLASGLTVEGSGCEIDNVEMFGFNHAAIKLRESAHVHHSHIHHNPMDGLGYGIMCLGGDHTLVEYNYFNYNRHSVANEGTAGYEVRFNKFGPEAVSYQVGTHQPGGTTLKIHHNTFEPVENIATDEDYENHISIRGTPDDVADIHNNWFHNSVKPLDSPDGWTREAIIQVHVDEWSNVDFHDNAYGKDEPSADVGCPR